MSIMPTWSFGRRRIVITASVWVRRCAGDRKPDRGYIRYVELLCQEAKAVRGRLTRCALRRPFRLELSPSRITLFSSLLSVSRHCSRGGRPFSTLVFFWFWGSCSTFYYYIEKFALLYSFRFGFFPFLLLVDEKTFFRCIDGQRVQSRRSLLSDSSSDFDAA